MNIKYVGFPSLGVQGKNLCLMCVFSIIFFIENMFAVKYYTRLKFAKRNNFFLLYCFLVQVKNGMVEPRIKRLYKGRGETNKEINGVGRRTMKKGKYLSNEKHNKIIAKGRKV
jgi:hypothetical protein